MWMKMTKITFKTIIFISQSKLEIDLSILELCLSIPPLARIIYDTLFNVIYMSEDIETRSLDFWKSGWKDVVESNNAMEKYFKENFRQIEEGKSIYLKESEILEVHKRLAQISVEEEKNPKKITKWPLAHGIKTQIEDRKTKAFLEFLYDCYQKRLGSHSHQSWVGLAERAFFFNEIVDQEKRRSILPGFKSDWLLLTITFLLALVSEINVVLDFDYNQQLLNLWFIIREYSFEAAKFYDIRYSHLLAHNE
jgi:hypothetical protein